MFSATNAKAFFANSEGQRDLLAWGTTPALVTQARELPPQKSLAL